MLLKHEKIRDPLIDNFKEKGILAVFHYVPLHDSKMGRYFGYTSGDFPKTEDCSKRIIRLPFYNDLGKAEQDEIIKCIFQMHKSIL